MPKIIKVTKQMIEIAEEASAKGLTREQIALTLGMGKTKLYEELNDNMELSEAVKRGSMKAVAEVANALYETAIGGNTTAQIFFLKNKGGWKDKTEVDNKHTLVLSENDMYKDLEDGNA